MINRVGLIGKETLVSNPNLNIKIQNVPTNYKTVYRRCAWATTAYLIGRGTYNMITETEMPDKILDKSLEIGVGSFVVGWIWPFYWAFTTTQFISDKLICK